MDSQVALWWSRLIIHSLPQTTWFISPGLRPWALYQVLEELEVPTISVKDERIAASMALGYAGQTNKPAICLCTSGTALAHYLPAVIEAKYSRTPMIILSADRSPADVAHQAHQAIDQQSVLSPMAQLINLPYPGKEQGDQLIRLLEPLREGVYHINVPLPDPVRERDLESNLPQLELRRPIVSSPEYVPQWKKLIDSWKQQNWRPFFLFGQSKAPEQNLDSFPYPYHIDVLSNLKGHRGLPSLDFEETRNWIKNNCTHVIHWGHIPLAKGLKQLVNESNLNYIRLHDDTKSDATGGVHQWVDVPGHYLSSFLAQFQGPAFRAPMIQFQQNLDHSPWSMPAFFNQLNHQTPLSLAHSLSIRGYDRYCQWRSPILSRWGTNGIDGQISLALGQNLACGVPTMAIMGDTAFYHDCQALELLSQRDLPVCLVVLNNAQGAIFSHLPIDVLPAMTMSHNISIEKLAHSFSWHYKRAHHLESWRDIVDSWHQHPHPLVVEIPLDAKEDLCLWKSLTPPRKDYEALVSGHQA